MSEISDDGGKNWMTGYIDGVPRPKQPWTFPSPFSVGSCLQSSHLESSPAPLAELRMYALSWAIRSKPDWQRKLAGPVIVAKWRKEALDQQEGVHINEKMTVNMVDYADPESGIEYSDRLIPTEVAENLRAAVAELEDVPDGSKTGIPAQTVKSSTCPSLQWRTPTVEITVLKCCRRMFSRSHHHHQIPAATTAPSSWTASPEDHIAYQQRLESLLDSALATLALLHEGHYAPVPPTFSRHTTEVLLALNRHIFTHPTITTCPVPVPTPAPAPSLPRAEPHFATPATYAATADPGRSTPKPPNPHTNKHSAVPSSRTTSPVPSTQVAPGTAATNRARLRASRLILYKTVNDALPAHTNQISGIQWTRKGNLVINARHGYCTAKLLAAQQVKIWNAIRPVLGLPRTFEQPKFEVDEPWHSVVLHGVPMPPSRSLDHIHLDDIQFWLDAAEAGTAMSFSVLCAAADFPTPTHGSVTLSSSYINNLHPTKHEPLYRLIESVLSSFIPLFEQVLSQINVQDKHLYEDVTPGSGRILVERTYGKWVRPDKFYKSTGTIVPCIWSKGEARYETGMTNEQYDRLHKEAPKVLPETYKEYTGELEKTVMPYSLRGMTIQCIIKLANIHLTVDNPEYKGDSWHVEGILNEYIVASGIYQYYEDNISESRLTFHVTTGSPVYHEQDEILIVAKIWGQLLRVLGVPSRGLQHRVAPFRLADPTKPGHRKILVIFLVDPSIEPIPSATNVPPQQLDWAVDALEQARCDPGSLLSRLPPELTELICDEFPDTLITREEAEDYRSRLMKERTAFVKLQDEQEVCEHTFNMCEH
ncbi:hypothetical protein DFH09DRAFT_1275846 [Mycena vulgaris]|nr:hypothetical protein DFH09DRAFT_1275846 [Mycena vulgaris]